MGADFTNALPISLEPADDESGLGIVFRVLLANGLSFRDAQHWLGLKTWNPINAQDIKVLAWIASVPQSWFAQRTVVTLERRPFRSYGLMGHRFGEGAADYLHSAKICPLCVKRNKYHRVTWQLRCICCCVEHALILSERCPHCGNLIRWNRPAIDICSCGGFLTTVGASSDLPLHVLNWVEWVESSLFHFEFRKPASSYGLPSFFSSLSIDGAFRVVLSVGLFPEVRFPPALAAASAQTSTGMAAIVARGIERLLSIGNELADIHSLNSIIHVPALERMRTIAATVADSNCASLLLNYLRADSKLGSEQRGRFHRGQLPLFN